MCGGILWCQEPLPGDDWRKKHDAVKLTLAGLFRWCGLQATCEVFNLFSHLIPQEGLTRMERERKRQDCVHDFSVLFPTQTGGSSARLAELKLIKQLRDTIS